MCVRFKCTAHWFSYTYIHNFSDYFPLCRLWQNIENIGFIFPFHSPSACSKWTISVVLGECLCVRIATELCWKAVGHHLIPSCCFHMWGDHQQIQTQARAENLQTHTHTHTHTHTRNSESREFWFIATWLPPRPQSHPHQPECGWHWSAWDVSGCADQYSISKARRMET